MTNNQAMVSAAMLEAVWATRKKDMIDLITPFVMYATATLTLVGQKIDTKKVQRYVQTNYAYTDMPESIIKKVLARNPYSAVRREERNFIFEKAIDNEIMRMDERKKQCEEYLYILGKELSKFLKTHCRREKNFSEEKAIECLHQFFARYGMQVGTDSLVSANISPKDYETEYYIARFIFKCKDDNSREYEYLKDLIKGYFLRQAIYIQPENGEIITASYTNITFFYDTPFLLDLLGYSGEERERNAVALHKMLQKQKGKFAYFPHIKQEVINILSAYKHSLDPNSRTNGFRTLEGLNKKNYNADDVNREIMLLESTLENKWKVMERELPPYVTKEDGCVDENKVLGESELKQYIRDNTLHYTDDNLDNDIKSALAVHRFRDGWFCNTLENCRYIFVTNNYDFTKTFNTYYKDTVEEKTFPLIISDSNLAALTWIKCGEISNLPESELLKNAYCALEPMPEMMKCVEEILQKLTFSGQIQPEQVVLLRTNRVLQNEIMKNALWDVNNINEESVQEVQRKYDERLLNDAALQYEEERKESARQFQEQLEQISREKSEKIQIYNQKIEDMNIELSRREDDEQQRLKLQQENSRRLADEFARQKRDEWYALRKRRLVIFEIIIIILGTIGIISSLVYNSNPVILSGMFIASIISIISIYDTVKTKSGFIIKQLEKKANQYETMIREEKMKEYRKIVQNNEKEK